MNRTVPTAVASCERGEICGRPKVSTCLPSPSDSSRDREPPAGLSGVKLLVQPVVTLGNFTSTLRLLSLAFEVTSSRSFVYQIPSPPKCQSQAFALELVIGLCTGSEVKLLSRVRLFATPWTVAYQDPRSMGFSRQEYWSGLPFHSPYIIFLMTKLLTKNLLPIQIYLFYFYTYVLEISANLKAKTF